MADKKISDLTNNPSINGTEEIAEERGGSNYKNNLADVKTYVKDGLNTSEVTESTDKKYVTDAEKVVIGNTSNTNTGDQDLSGLQPILSEGAFVDGDKTKLDGVETGAEVNTINSKTAGEPTGSDVILNTVSLTQAEYDAGTPIATTLYVITDA